MTTTGGPDGKLYPPGHWDEPRGEYRDGTGDRPRSFLPAHELTECVVAVILHQVNPDGNPRNMIAGRGPRVPQNLRTLPNWRTRDFGNAANGEQPTTAAPPPDPVPRRGGQRQGPANPFDVLNNAGDGDDDDDEDDDDEEGDDGSQGLIASPGQRNQRDETRVRALVADLGRRAPARIRTVLDRIAVEVDNEVRDDEMELN
ncbi:hypothetical protein F4780DRAFT_460464 [Xylariomycetidae sp. FL0641]|nr:hypothetical protein F4780DRAFT_460464 [Xylariomycetidae sp. FL0641]